MDETSLNALVSGEDEELELSELNIKWKVSELCMEFEKYDNLKDKCDGVEEDLDEMEDDDTELDREERLTKKILKLKKKNYLRLIEEHEESLTYKWNALEKYINDDECMKGISRGDSYFMTSVFRVRKEFSDMVNQDLNSL